MPTAIWKLHPLTDIDRWEGTANCVVCGGRVVIEPQGKNWWICANLAASYRAEWRAKRKHKAAQSTRPTHRLPKAQAEALRVAAGRCAICAGVRRLVVDHDHVTGKVRGVICHECNVGLGWFRDDPVRLQAAIRYLTEPGPD